MAFEALTNTETAAGKAIVQALMRKIKTNFDALFVAVDTLSSNNIPNGSFEVYDAVTDTPVNWVLPPPYPGGSVARDTATPTHGAAGLKMVHPGGAGNGGGTATSDFVPCSELAPVVVEMIHYATAADMNNQVIFYWYDKNKVACATPSTTVYNSTTNPISAALLICGATPPATARFFTIRLVGGESSVNVAGTAYWDGLKLLEVNPSRIVASETSLAVQSVANIGWVDADSFTIHPSVFGLDITISFVAEVKGRRYDVEAGYFYARQRFRVGSVYSGEFAATSDTDYAAWPYALTVPSSPMITIVQQLRQDGGTIAYGRKLSTGSTNIASY